MPRITGDGEDFNFYKKKKSGEGKKKKKKKKKKNQIDGEVFTLFRETGTRF
jgi:hypothetical protein